MPLVPSQDEHDAVAASALRSTRRLDDHANLFDDQAEVNNAGAAVINDHEARLLALEGGTPVDPVDPPVVTEHWEAEPPSRNGYTVFTREPDPETGFRHEAYATIISISVVEPGITEIWIGEKNNPANPRKIRIEYEIALDSEVLGVVEHQLVRDQIDPISVPPSPLYILTVISAGDQNVPLFAVDVEGDVTPAITVIGSTATIPPIDPPIEPPPLPPADHIAPEPPPEPAGFDTEIRLGDDVFAAVRNAPVAGNIKIHPGTYVGQWFEPREGQTIWMAGTRWDGVGTRQWIRRLPGGARFVRLIGPAEAFGYAKTQPRKWQSGILDFRTQHSYALDVPHSKWYVWDIEVHSSNGVGIYLGGESKVVRCTAHHMSNLGFGGYMCSRTEMWDCEGSDNTTHGDHGWEAGGFKAVVNDGMRVYRWKAFRNAGPGWWPDISVSDLLLEDFEIADNLRGIHDEIGYDSTYLNGVLRDNGSGSPWLWGSQFLVSTSQGIVAKGITIEGDRDAIGLINQPFRIPERLHPSTVPNRHARIYETRDVLLEEFTLRPTGMVQIGANSDGGSTLVGRNLNFEGFTEDLSQGQIGYVWNGGKTRQQWDQLQPNYA